MRPAGCMIASREKKMHRTDAIHASATPLSWRHAVAWSFGLTLASLAIFLWAKAQVLPGWHAPMTFDGMYYQSIFSDGYAFDGDIERKGNTAFLPLMAGLIGLASLLPGANAYLEVVALGAMVLFATLLGLYHLATTTTGTRTAGVLAASFWALSPMAFYNFVGYGEPVFAMLAAWTLVAMRSERAWWAAALSGMTLLCRPVGLVLALIVAGWIAWRHRRNLAELFAGPAILQVVLIFAPIMLFATWAVSHFGDSIVYVNSMEAWRRGSVLDGNQSAWPALRYFFHAVTNDTGAIEGWTVLLASLSMGVVAWVFLIASREDAWLSLFYVALLVFMLSTSSLDVMNFARRSLYMIPWALLVGSAIARRGTIAWTGWLGMALWFLLATLIQVSAISRYYRGEWVS